MPPTTYLKHSLPYPRSQHIASQIPASILTATTTPALVAVVLKDKLKVEGPLKKWKGTADSGNAVYRWFCSECGSPIAHAPDGAPIVALKGGCLDNEIKKNLKPVRTPIRVCWG